MDAADYMNAACERMAEAHWNLTANIPWKEIPEEWKGPERKRMAVAIMAHRNFERDEHEALRGVP